MITNFFGIPFYITYESLISWLESQSQFIGIVFSNDVLLILWILTNILYIYIWFKLIIPLIKFIIYLVRSWV